MKTDYDNDFPQWYVALPEFTTDTYEPPIDECVLAAAEYQAYLEKVDQDWTLLVEALTAAFAPRSPMDQVVMEKTSDQAECYAVIDQQRDAAGTDPYAEHVAQMTSPMFFVEPLEFGELGQTPGQVLWGAGIVQLAKAEVQGLAGVRIPYAAEVTVYDEIDSCEQELFIDMFVYGTQDYREIMDIAGAEVEFAGYRSGAFNYVITPSQFGDRVVVEVLWS